MQFTNNLNTNNINQNSVQINKKMMSPTRRYNKPEMMSIEKEMLGAGTDPIAKESEFSVLAGSGQLLMQSEFLKPGFQKIRYPPVLDRFSRTLAAPLCSQKYNLSVVNRIGNMYTHSAQKLYLDYQSRSARISQDQQQSIVFTANPELLLPPATEQELLQYILKEYTSEQYYSLQKKVQSKQKNYTRYYNYIQNEIHVDQVANIRQYWITNILDLIPAEFQNLQKDYVEQMIDDMLNEVNQDYYDSIRKSILDYVLKDPDERQRIGITETYLQVPDYGIPADKKIMADAECKQITKTSKEFINEHLVIYNKGTLKMMEIWVNYQSKYFLQLPGKKDQTMTIQYFIKLQEDRISEIKTLLEVEWIKELKDIYQEELSTMGKNKKQAIIFFEANSTLMANQLRKLIEETLIIYRDFLNRFYKQKLITPQEIIKNEKNSEFLLEDVFLVVKLKDERQQIVFQDSLDFIKVELIRIVSEIVQTSHSFPRPENTLARRDKNTIWKVPFEDQLVCRIEAEIENIIDINHSNICKVLDVYNEFNYLLKEQENIQIFVSNLALTRIDFEKQIKRIESIYQDINSRLPYTIRTNMILIDGVDVKKKYLQICEDLQNTLMKSINAILLRRNHEIQKEISNLVDSITFKVDSEDLLVTIEKNIEKIRHKDQKEINNEFQDLIKWQSLYFSQIQTYIFNKQEDEYALRWDEQYKQVLITSEQTILISSQVQAEEERVSNDRKFLEAKLTERKKQFVSFIDGLEREVLNLKNEFKDDYQVDAANNSIENLDNQLNDALKNMENINVNEDLIGFTITEFVKVQEIQSKLIPQKTLWKLVDDFKNKKQLWTKDTNIFKLDPEDIEKQIKVMHTQIIKLANEFRNEPNLSKLVERLMKDIQSFKQDMPLINIFCNKGFKERHWQEINDLIQNTGVVVGPDKQTKFRTLIEQSVSNYMTQLEEINETATKEYNIEQIMNKMLMDWDEVLVEIKAWKATGTFTVSGGSVEEVQTLLDDQLVKTQTMKGNPYAKIFEHRIVEWESWLQYSSSLFEYWIKVQQVWIYLEPIFGSPDIVKHLPNEAVKFREVDSHWRNIMTKIHANTKVVEFTKNKKFLDILKESHESLEMVQKGLNAYLEGKRANFPRFYFLSNDELLEILRETKDPTRVEPHLKKCFEGINKLKFDADKKIYGMYSGEGEYVEYTNDVIDTVKARGQVDQWLIQVESAMIQSVKNVTAIAFQHYTQLQRTHWVIDRCGMAVLCVGMTFWTYQAEQALIQDGAKGCIQLTKVLNQQIEDIVRLIRTDISQLNRLTVEALIVLDVHNKEIIRKMGEAGVNKTQDFDWQSQLRYYFLETNSSISVKIVNAVMDYCNEYLGNSSRLVITDLTDRCYRTLCGAINLNYGGAPEGPAGTGKTETVKDLAKALARLCVVFNCSDGLDYKAMGKFFKGLASSGGWSCFDEFNRIELEVLSVIAQQIMSIQLAKSQGKHEFEFEDVKNLKLIHTCNAFITMNPGYAGRSDLPDNLKALFRSVAMMIPNYELIAEISLYSYGFSYAKQLANKIVTTYKLCSEQLSSQKHYDYGMRAVKSVLVAAGNLKKKFPDENEYILLLRSIQDVNVAKFFAFDLPLFSGITKDLFPGIQVPEIDYKAMYSAISQRLQARNLTNTPYFVQKIIQLYEMILVRHGLMVVGMPFSGKTSILHVLAEALGILNEKGEMNEQKTQIVTLNPKSITMQLLYGFSDKVTGEWTDGLIAVKFRNLAKDESVDRKWLIFDGPVDAIWIENMNTVLDDNKKLCLNSGEQIQMSKSMNMIFEPMDLLVASPATVSRCGMIYMEPEQMGWRPLFTSWTKTLDYINKEDIEEIISLFEWTIDHTLYFIRKKCQEVSPTMDQFLVNTLIRMLTIFLKMDLGTVKFYQSLELKDRHLIISHRFIFCVVWSLGGAIRTESRKPFDLFLKKLFSGDIHTITKDDKKRKIGGIPDRGLIYDYQYAVHQNKADNQGEWIRWIDLIDPTEVIPPKIQPQEIMVKTVDTVRYTYLLKQNILNEYPTLFCGPTGTGKSIYIKDLLINGLDRSIYSAIEVGFSAQTTCTQTQEIIDGKLDRKRRGIFGPKSGKAIIFVDDLNMPAKEAWGAQPPIEILRQMIDQQGWYDNKEKEKSFKQLVDIIFVGAMGPPGGGKTFVSPRLLRHMSLLSLASFDDDTMGRIFSTILQWFFTNNNFNPDVSRVEGKVVQATLDIYNKVTVNLLPTPAKSHYLFNLRDFSKVILGICMAHKDYITTIDSLVRLWTHEIFRVFVDRLINQKDRIFMLEAVRESVKTKFQMNFDQVFARLDQEIDGVKDGKVDTLDEIRRLMFSDIGQPAKKIYEEITDLNRLQEQCEDALKNFNNLTDKRMDLVLFSFAIEHLLIIGRILKCPGGHALLVGVGGSGRQSLTRLAASVADQEVFSIEITRTYNNMDWKEDIKKILKMSGGKNIPTVFLFTDSQIKEEGFVEDINTILNTGELPNLFLPEEKAELLEMVRPFAKGAIGDGTPAQLFNFFITLVKKNLHIVLCMSYIGDAFRNRVKMFPSLVNCCTIDWFFEWPQDALVSVAKKFFSDISLEDNIKAKCVQMVQYYHESTVQWAQLYWDSLKRKYYVTPTSYLELIMTFQKLLDEKRQEVMKSKNKYDNGYQQIVRTELEVDKMKEKLIKMQPELKKAAEDTEKKVIEVTAEKLETDKIAEVVGKDEAVAKKAKDEASVIRIECQTDLDKAKPAQLAAERALEQLEGQKDELNKLKTYKTVSETIQFTMKCLMFLIVENPTEKKKNEKTLKMEIDWWAVTVKCLNTSGFINKLLDFKSKDVKESQIAKLRAEFENPDNANFLIEANLIKASQACKCIMDWVQGIYNFYLIYKDIKPKEEKLATANEIVRSLSETLAVKQAELKKATDKVANMNRELQQNIETKERLETNYQECTVQLQRAVQLIDNLGDEKLRWKQLGEDLGDFYISLTGDVLISSGLIAYLGAFTSKFRSDIAEQWIAKVKELSIPQSEKYSFINVCGDPVLVRAWNIDGLPQSTFSIENAIIMSKTRRWPLCIDPQGQANKWIKKMGQPKGLAIIKLTDPTFLRTLENCIQFGKPVLLENVGEELDPALTPILLKQTYVKGTTTYIKLGDQAVEYSPLFFFYITTKFRNPHYLPEISTKVTLLNFMITYDGLNDQLLGILVKKERPELEEEKEKLILEGASNKKQLSEIEKKILEVLMSDGDILSDEKAINILTASKTTSNEIKVKQEIAEKTEETIDFTRSQYQSVSQEASCLFFAITDLNNIDPMYQYSLTYYIDLFTAAIVKSAKSDDLDKRLHNLKEFFLYSLYSNICRSLFEKDKLLLSFLLATRLFTFRGELSEDYFRFVLTGGVSLDSHLPEMPHDQPWLSLKAWGEIYRLSQMTGFTDLHVNIAENISSFKVIYDSLQPQSEPLPVQTQQQYNFNSFQKLMILRTIRPDKIIPGIQDYVSEKMGPKFIDPPGFNLPQIYDDSTNIKPLVFVLSPGSDPFQSLNNFGIQMKQSIKQISLGQGQGVYAEALITNGVEKGTWVVLQNCHLAVSWMNSLEKICEDLVNKEVHKDFRLWLTSYPSEKFPTSILQNGVKMTNEPPKGLKANLTSSLNTDPIVLNDFFEGCQHDQAFKRLTYGLCFFHAVIQERRKYGPLGWNIPYEFNESDLRISAKQVRMFLEEMTDNDPIPYPALQYMTGECNYGGRVTQETDRKLLMTLLSDYFCQKLVSDKEYNITPIEIYKLPFDINTHADYLEYIKSLPLNSEPSIFGFHANANITKDINETNLLFESLLICSQTTGGSGKGLSLEETLDALATNILNDFPLPFNEEDAALKYPFCVTESMNTVITQELGRYNTLIKEVRSSLSDLKRALKGEILLSVQLDQASKQIFDGKVPTLWLNVSYPSLKPLGSYILDLKLRISFFQDWLDNGIPSKFWLSGIYFTQSFLTGVTQNFSRKYVIPIDELVFEFEIADISECENKPLDGAFVDGLFLEGAKFNYEKQSLDESDPKVLFTSCPILLLKPCRRNELTHYANYDCPLYKVSSRRGTLSTTGHNSNWVMDIKLPIQNQQTPQHWIKRGVALLTQLDD